MTHHPFDRPDNAQSRPSPQLIAEVRATMSAPSFRPDNEGYATVSEVAREVRRSLDAVRRTLLDGESAGQFASRPHPTLRNGSTGENVREYRAIL